MILMTLMLLMILAILMIPCVLFSRLAIVSIPMSLFKKYRMYAPKIIAVLTWGGLRGALALSMALSLPDSPQREVILMMTYGVVLFSIVVQGLTIRRLIPEAHQDEKNPT